MNPATPFTLRNAELRDVGAIVQLIRDLAEFEQLSHLVQVTPEKLRPQLFGERPAAEAMVAELGDGKGKSGGEVVAFALFFTNFSTFLAQPGLYLEDLYVKPEHRGAGIGKALLTRLAALALERNCGRFEWSVLDWNENAIRFYEGMGATVMPEWRICRVTGDALQRFKPGPAGRMKGPARGPGRRGVRRVAATIVVAITLALVGLTLAQRGSGEASSWLELSRYLPYYWLLLPGVAGFVLSLWLGRAWILVGAAGLAVLGTATMGLNWGSGEPAAERVRLMTFNAKAATAAERSDGILRLGAEVAKHDPDILVMQDADGLLVQRSDPELTASAPVFGLSNVYALGQYVVLSRLPLRGCTPGNIDYRDEAHRYLRCSFDVHGVELTVVTAHFKSPRSGLSATRFQGLDGADEWQQNFQDRLTQSRALARDLRQLRGPLVVAGDLNAPEESPVVGNLLATGLRDAFSAAGRGYGYTYGHTMRAGLSFLRIDHILVSPDIAVADSFAGGDKASDHRPVIADLSLRRTGGSRPE